MTESIATATNSNRSIWDGDDDDYHPLDSFVIPVDPQKDYANEEYDLFNDDEDEDNLTLFDLKSIPKSEHDLSIFDELVQQCNDVLSSTSHSHERITFAKNTANVESTDDTTMMNDYERRFQRSVRKLTIPSWYNDRSPSPKHPSKPALILSTYSPQDESQRTPEIMHIRRPHSYRSCRSSVGTSPSPSAHSWHPNCLIEGVPYAPSAPSRATSNARRHRKYEKGIERVTKASHWYQPAQLTAKSELIPHQTSKIAEKKPRVDADAVSDRIHPIPVDGKSNVDSRQAKSNGWLDEGGLEKIKNISINEQNNNNDKGEIASTHDKQGDKSIESNELSIMSSENEKTSFARVELEEVTDEEENDKLSSTHSHHVQSSITEESNDQPPTASASIERLADRLVESLLNEILAVQGLDQDDETSAGVRELSDDENALRELDENDMSGTDEFILFATNEEISNEDNGNNDDHEIENPLSPIGNRGSSNRLYTFSRNNDDGIISNSKAIFSNQDTTTSTVMIVDKDLSPTHLNVNERNSSITDEEDSFPTYRSHIQKRHINLGRYYDGMMRSKASQLPTYDLCANLNSNRSIPRVDEGVTEETVRQGRILLDQIPKTMESNKNTSEQSMPIRSILKNPRLDLQDEQREPTPTNSLLKIEEKEGNSPRKIITTITEEYHRIHRKIIEQIIDDFPSHTSPEQRIQQQSFKPSVSTTDASPYQFLSECYSGYSHLRNAYSTPMKSALTSNVSSLQTTTDEAYESEHTTASPRSPTNSSSIAPHIHPELEHEFEYPSPPPPVPDRRLKPAHLRPPPPPTKPRSLKQQEPEKIESTAIYSKINKQAKPSPLATIQHLLASTADDSTPASSSRTLSSRHFCGTIPVANDLLTSPPTSAEMNEKKAKRNSKSSSKTRSKKPSSTHFDEATNGLAIRLPVSEPNGQDSQRRTSTPSTSKRTDAPPKHRPVSENMITNRSSVYETSV